MTYEELLTIADNDGLIVKEKLLRGNNGRIKGNKIAIKKDILTVEKKCTLAEEMGHYYTTTGNILNQKDTKNRKQELFARLWAYNNQIGLIGLIDCYNHGCTSHHEMAEYLDVSESFLREALECYKSKYGLCTKVDNYIIYFEPYLGVIELFD